MRVGGSLGSQGLDMSKALLNGGGPGVVDASAEDAATMVAAIQDHLASCKNMQENNFAGMEIKEERFPCDFDHMYASMAEHDSAAAAAEVRQLKDLLLLHLDLIQQQSELLVNKDKQLCNLRQENDMLRQRLERMDRRVTLHHNKRHSTEPPVPGTPGFPGEQPTTSPTEMSEVPCTGSEDDTGSLSLQPFPKVEGSPSPRGSPLSLGTKHLPIPERASRSRKSSWSSDTATSRRSANSDRGGDSGSRNRTDSPIVNTTKRSRVSQNRRETNDTDDTATTTDSVRPARVTSGAALGMVTTPVLYYVPKRIKLGNGAHADEDEPSPQSLLEVPRWRIKLCTSCYSMEGTENLEDEVFLKRHQRLELDERRRKRWDIQRLREQRQYEKLRQRQTSQQVGGRRGAAARRRNQQQEPTYLWPDPDEVQYIEVDNIVPVTAFGVPIPNFAPTLFRLPWVTDPESYAEDRQEFKKQVEQEQEQKVKQEKAKREQRQNAQRVVVKQEPEDPPTSPTLPPPPPPPPIQPTPPPSRSQQASRRRSRGGGGSSEKRRTSTRRR